MTQIIVITPEEISATKDLNQTLEDAYNHSHFALDKLIAVVTEMEFGDNFNRQEVIQTLKDSMKDIRKARSLNGHILNHVKGKK